MDVRQFIRQQTSRYTAAARKLLSIKGEEYAVSFGVHLEDERPEFSILKQETLFAQWNQATSAAGTLPIIGITNPPTSGVLAVITSVHAYVLTPGAGVLLNAGYALVHDVSLGSHGSMHTRDLRRRNSPSTTVQYMAGTSAVSGLSVYGQVVPLVANEIIDLVSPAARIPPIILGPNSQFGVWLNAVGVNTLSVFIAGYERPLESGEMVV